MRLIFDLDGTLVDSRPGIVRSLHDAVRQVFPAIDPAGLDFEIGPPVETMFQLALGAISPTELGALNAAFRSSYDSGGWTLSRAYPGVRETLEELASRGHHTYIVTNKPAIPAARILGHLGLSRYFEEILSPDSRQPKFKDKVEILGYLLRAKQIPRDDAIYAGDSQDDLYAAERYDIRFLGIEYGYGFLPKREKEFQAIKSFAELLLVPGIIRDES